MNKFDITKQPIKDVNELLKKFNEAKKENKKLYDDVGNTIEVYKVTAVPVDDPSL